MNIKRILGKHSFRTTFDTELVILPLTALPPLLSTPALAGVGRYANGMTRNFPVLGFMTSLTSTLHRSEYVCDEHIHLIGEYCVDQIFCNLF